MNVKRLFNKLILHAVLVLIVFIFAAGNVIGDDGVSEVRVERLSRGINIPGWLWLGPRQAPQFDERISSDDLQLIKDVGFQHVRIPIAWKTIYDANEKSLLNQKSLKNLDAGVKTLIENRLGVIIDLHQIQVEGESSNYSGPIEHDPEFVKTFIAFWSSFAEHLSQFDPDYLFIEPMNEPTFSGHTDDWLPIQKRLVTAIRKSAPKHTILATSAQWSGLETFLKLKPLDDANIVYNFHYYHPFKFTHQGATWSSPQVRPMREVPYPSSPELVKKAVDLVENEESKAWLRDYGNNAWDAKKIDEEIAKAEAWAMKYDVPVTCNEFGAYKRYAPREDLLRWHRDVIAALEKHNIGWSKWELDGGFGFFNKKDGHLVLDKELTEAMRMNVNAGK